MFSLRFRNRAFSLTVLLVGVLWAAAAHAQEEFLEVTVKRGDSLYGICNIYLEKFSQWPEIAKFNNLGDAHRLIPGQRLKIPVHLLQGTPLIGKVSFAKGEVHIRAGADLAWVPLKLGDLVRQRDWLRTGAASALEIQFDDGDTLFLPSQSTAEMTLLRSKSFTHRLYEIFLETGRIITKIRKITGKESRFEIQTPSTVAAVRGTDFRIASDALKTSRCEVLEGRLVVTAQDKGVALDQYEGTLIALNQAPLKPRPLLLAPRPQDLKPLYRQLPLRIAVGQVDKAAAYRLQVARDPTIKDLVKDLTVGPGESFQIMDIEDGQYYIGLTALDAEGVEGRPSEAIVLKVRTNPRPPFLSSAKEGKLFFEKRAQFEWLKVSDAVAYRLQIAADSGFEGIVLDQEQKADALSLTAPLESGNYFFRVASLAADGYQGVWSDPTTFAITPNPPLTSDPEIGEDQITLRWSDAGDQFSYHFQLSADEDFSDIRLDRPIDAPQLTLPRPETAGTYYTRVSTVSPQGVEGAFSPPQSFHVVAPPSWLDRVLGIGAPLVIVLLLMI
ncbi:MAG: FecR domain-containing protein [Desulfobacterales bacterium]